MEKLQMKEGVVCQGIPHDKVAGMMSEPVLKV